MFDDFQLVYGNDNKIDEAVEKAKYSFSTREPVADLTVTEVESGSGINNPGVVSTVTSMYSAVAENAVLFEWEVLDNPRITIYVNPEDSSECIVSSESFATTETFTLTVKATGRLGDTITVSNQYTHNRTQIAVVSIVSITENASGSCDYPTGGTCSAESLYTATVSGNVSYQWSISGNAKISSSTNQNTVSVATNSGNDTSFILTLDIKDALSSDTMSQQFSHTRTERKSVNIIGFEEVQAGCCVYA